jgi:hypothetical protein
MHLRAVFPFPMESAFMTTCLDDNAGVSEVPSDRDIVAAVCDRAVTDDSYDEHEIGACDIQSERQIVTTKDAVRAFKVIMQYSDAHGADDKLDIEIFYIEKDHQRRLSNAKTQTNITDFLKLRQNSVLFWMCKINVFMSIYNKSENKHNLSGINLNFFKCNLT